MKKTTAKKTTKKATTEVTEAPEIKISYDLKQGVMYADCQKSEGLEVIRSAAYVLTDRSFARLESGPKDTVRVTLQLKGSTELTPGDAKKDLEALAQTFQDEVATQRLRHQISKNNVSIREYIVEQAVRLAQQPAETAPPPMAPAEPELTDAQRKEIERLIAEVEEEIRSMAPAKAAQDPLKISATWEETHAPKTENK